MHAIRKKINWSILAAAVIAVGVLAGAAPERKSRLVSVQQLPKNLEVCNWDGSAGAKLNAESPEEKVLFSALQREPSLTLMAAAQFTSPNTEEQEREAAELRAHGARTPVRTLRDTAPTYSAVGIDLNS